MKPVGSTLKDQQPTEVAGTREMVSRNQHKLDLAQLRHGDELRVLEAVLPVDDPARLCQLLVATIHERDGSLGRGDVKGPSRADAVAGNGPGKRWRCEEEDDEGQDAHARKLRER